VPFLDIQSIAARAADIYDRASRVTPADAKVAAWAPDPAALAAVQAWNQAFSPGDEDAFRRRLAWDNLDLPTVLAAASDARPPARTPPWATWLERAGRAGLAVAVEVASRRFASDPLLHVPFEEIWTAFRRAAAAAVAGPTDRPSVVRPTARASLERQLCIELARQGELALFEYFRAASAARHSPGPDSRYRACVIRLLETGFVPFIVEYPALARLLAGLTGDWVESTREFLDRLVADRDEIARLFGADPGAVSSIEPGVSDPHHGRRRVSIVGFESGLRLVYKPRSVGIDAAFNRFLGWINADLPAPLTVLKVLDRGTHGWIEYAAHAPAADRQSAARSFRQSGELMAVAYLLGAQDLHMENLVATAHGPVVVDTEMVLQPVAKAAASNRDAAEVGEGLTPNLSVLDSGFLTLVTVTDAGEVYDSGGMRGQATGPLPFPQRVWRALATDLLHYDEEPSYTSAARHRVLLGGVPQDPGDYAEDVRVGFADAYRILLARRRELSAADGPLHLFAGTSARVTLRPTNKYAMLSVVLARPKYQRTGVARSTVIDVLHREWAGAVSRPTLWPAALEERRAIERLDVPYFSVLCDGVDLRCEGRVVVCRHFAQSGLHTALARAERLSEEDLNAQSARLVRALGETVTSRFAQPAPREERDNERALALARWIALELVARADRTGDALTWRYQLDADQQSAWEHHALYGGTIGPALLFAALAAASGDTDAKNEWRQHARGALRPLRLAIEGDRLLAGSTPVSIGGLTGLGSIVYGLTVAGSLVDDTQLLDLASHVAASIAPRIDPDDHLDVLDGAAGAALALLALFDATGDPEVLRLATACGDHLIQRAVSTGDGLAWPSPDGTRLVGFAHGAAGVSYALARLFCSTGAKRFRDAARLGCQFVQGHFLPLAGNYAMAAPAGDASPGRGRTMLSWCHGTPGIVPSLGPPLDICEKTAMLSQFDLALRTLGRDEPLQVDHLCCGASGRVEALLTSGRALGRTDLVRNAWQLADAVATRAAARGHFRLSGDGVEYRVFDPGFFRGLSGVGYQWLRLASPAIPSIARLESPARRG
jgi:type 2 lantibiotic biosynthesis protein LanM